MLNDVKFIYSIMFEEFKLYNKLIIKLLPIAAAVTRFVIVFIEYYV